MANCSVSKKALMCVGIIALIVIIDQIIKIIIKTHMYLREDFAIFDWFHICFTENRGMAFGMDIFGTLFLSIFRIVFAAFIVAYLRKVLQWQAPKGFLVCVSMILAGAFGNLVDNALYGLVFSESTYYQMASFVPFGEGYSSFLSGRVVDMFYFPLFEFDWPSWMPFVGGEHFLFFGAIFNMADASISCGGVATLLCYPKYLSKTLGRFLNHE